MKFYLAEKEAFDELSRAQTLGDVVRIGFNRVDFKDKNGEWFECYDIVGDGKVCAYARVDDNGNTKSSELSPDIVIDQLETALDRDEDQYTIVSVKEKV